MVALDVRSVSASGPRARRPRRSAPRHRRKRRLERRWRSAQTRSILGDAGPVAQRIEHRFPKPGVAGSSPAGVAILPVLGQWATFWSDAYTKMADKSDSGK